VVEEEMNMFKRTALSAFCAAVMLVTVGYAQESATLTLRSGEKVSGQLVDLGGVGYTIRVNGTNRTIPENSVAAVDFTGAMSDADWAKFSGSPVIVLRNGQTVQGSLADIGGTSPLKLTVHTSSGDREMSSTDVAEIITARPDNAVATAGTTAVNPAVTQTQAVPGAIAVPANQPWTATNRTVRKGQTVSFSATGQIQLSTDTNDIADANGSKQARYAANAPLKNVLAGALIGRIGTNGTPFPVGQQTLTMPASGVLYLGVNDDGFPDNQGTFQVVIR
jgi:hypothetical protein